jgi:hypothetical protein
MKRLFVALAAGLFAISSVQAEVGDSLISPDGKWTVFVVKGSGPSVTSGAGDYESSELWQTDSHGENRTLLASTHNDDDVRYLVAQFNDLKFSTDGRLVYFDTPAWGTSAAVHVVDTTTGKEHFVCPGSILQVVHSSKGDQLVVSQKRYHPAPQYGAYWRKYLLTTDGREIRPLGEIEE